MKKKDDQEQATGESTKPVVEAKTGEGEMSESQLSSEQKTKEDEPVPAEPVKELATGASPAREVTLKGTASQMVGYHTLFFGNGIVTFHDGQATIPEELAAALQAAGYVE